jgi:hypothetical protein
MADDPTREQLFDLYKIAIEEYRFAVRLGWDRTNYFLILNSAIFAIATGLLKLDNPPVVYLFISLIFLFGLTTSIAGARSVAKAHEYYRRTIVKKTAMEEHLGLSSALPGMHESFNLAIGTTRGQNDRLMILNDPEKWVARPQRRSSITFLLSVILWTMAAVNGIGVVAGIFLMHQKSTSITSTSPERLQYPFF